MVRSCPRPSPTPRLACRSASAASSAACAKISRSRPGGIVPWRRWSCCSGTASAACWPGSVPRPPVPNTASPAPGGRSRGAVRQPPRRAIPCLASSAGPDAPGARMCRAWRTAPAAARRSGGAASPRHGAALAATASAALAHAAMAARAGHPARRTGRPTRLVAAARPPASPARRPRNHATARPAHPPAPTETAARARLKPRPPPYAHYVTLSER